MATESAVVEKVTSHETRPSPPAPARGPGYSSGVGRLYADDLIVKIEGPGGTMIMSA